MAFSEEDIRSIWVASALGVIVGSLLAFATAAGFVLRLRLKSLRLTTLAQLLIVSLSLLALWVTRVALNHLQITNRSYWRLAVAVEAAIWLSTVLLLAARAD